MREAAISVEGKVSEAERSVGQNGSAEIVRTHQDMMAMLAEVSRVRGLAALAPLRSAVLSRDELMRVVREHVDKEIPADVMRDQGEFMAALGLVPLGFDYETGVLGLLRAQLAGFYEPSNKTMYVAADLVGPPAEATLAHELVHALQDQHYDLAPKLAYAAEANDRLSAVQALAEGDATSAMMDVLGRQTGRQAIDLPDEVFASNVEASVATGDLADVPRVLRASLAAPYVDGVLFVHKLRRAGGWKAVDSVWRSPPETTEQILHPAKYEAHEAAEEVGLPRAPRDGQWIPAYHDVFGEQGLRIVLEEWLTKREAAAVAEGWAGDHAALFRSAGSAAMADGSAQTQLMAVAWRVRFDLEAGRKTETAAKRLFRSLAKAFGASKVAGGAFCRDRAGLGAVAVAHGRRDVAIVVGPYARQGTTVVARAGCQRVTTWARDNLAVGSEARTRPEPS